MQPRPSESIYNKLLTASTLVQFRPALISGYAIGALDMSLASRRILSIPTQLGCRVGCTFCISSTQPLIRNLSANDMLSMVRSCLAAESADGRPMELSFTGEGEPALNWKAAAQVCRELASLSPDFNAVRYCFSGIGADRLLGKLDGGPYPVRLQFSLHAARQSVRSALVPNSLPLDRIAIALQETRHRFSAIELNVVLQEGVNDSPEDLAALADWGDPAWPILLNPLLRDGQEHIAATTDWAQALLEGAGRRVLRYTRIAERISRERIYPLLSARALSAS